MAAPKARELTREEVLEIRSLTREDIDLKLLTDYFGVVRGQDKPRFNTYDTFKLPAGAYYNKEYITTTVGRYIVNLSIFPESYLEKYGYVNETLSKKALGNIESKMGPMLLMDEMTTKDYTDKYLDRGEWIGMGVAYFLAPTMDFNIIQPVPEATELRDQLYNQNRAAIEKGDINVLAKIDAECLKVAKPKIIEAGNESFDYFEAGVGSYENNYKKSSLAVGTIENPYTKKLEFIRNNYTDGITKEEYEKVVNLTVIGGYSRGVETQSSGYETKKINNALQSIALDDEGSDCGTKLYLEVELDKEDLYMYRWILDTNGQLVMLTPDNFGKYKGKIVKMRSPMMCKSENICSKCAGGLFYKIGIENPGLVNFAMSGNLMNKSMKKMHDSTIKFNKVNISDFITEH